MPGQAGITLNSKDADERGRKAASLSDCNAIGAALEAEVLGSVTTSGEEIAPKHSENGVTPDLVWVLTAAAWPFAARGSAAKDEIRPLPAAAPTGDAGVVGVADGEAEGGSASTLM